MAGDEAFGRIAEIWRYPVSSLGGERLPEAALASGGIPGDRLWGVADRDSGEVAMPERRRRWRPAPELKARLSAGGAGAEAPAVEVAGPDADWQPVDSPAAAELAGRHFGFAVAFRRHVAYREADDGAPVPVPPDRVMPRYGRDDLHILTTASLARLQAWLPDGARLDPRRFRPNLVIETGEERQGFVEAGLIGRTLAVGEARVRISEPCQRCAFTTLAQGDLPLDPAILQAIARQGGGNFGALCRVEVAGRLTLGDAVTLLPPD